jgi:predicted SAM-dependent methyltransferase
MKLNLGCGNSRLTDYCNVDILKTTATDVVADLEGSLPFKDNSVEMIRAKFLLEHLQNPFHLLNEGYRILKLGGKFEIQVPHALSPTFLEHPDHKTTFTYQTLQYLTGEKEEAKQYYQYRYAIERFEFFYARDKFKLFSSPAVKIMNVIPSLSSFLPKLFPMDLRMFIVLKKVETIRYD